MRRNLTYRQKDQLPLKYKQYHPVEESSYFNKDPGGVRTLIALHHGPKTGIVPFASRGGRVNILCGSNNSANTWNVMGFHCLFPFLLKFSKKINLREFTGQTVCIDVSCWLHNGLAQKARKVRDSESLLQRLWWFKIPKTWTLLLKTPCFKGIMIFSEAIYAPWRMPDLEGSTP